jgi:hypothetical protein
MNSILFVYDLLNDAVRSIEWHYDLVVYWKTCGRKKKEKKQNSQYSGQDSNRGPLRMQISNVPVAANALGAKGSGINMTSNNCT